MFNKNRATRKRSRPEEDEDNFDNNDNLRSFAEKVKKTKAAKQKQEDKKGVDYDSSEETENLACQILYNSSDIYIQLQLLVGEGEGKIPSD